MPAPTARTTASPAPRCILIAGPTGAEKVRWLQATIHALRADGLAAHCAVLATPEIAGEMERFAQAVPHVSVRRLVLPCLCCPGAAELPRRVRALAEESGADRLFVDLPVLAAAGLIAEFDALVRWPREVVVCLNDAWTEARHTDSLSYFQFSLISAADRVIDAPERPVLIRRRVEVSHRLIPA